MDCTVEPSDMVTVTLSGRFGLTPSSVVIGSTDADLATAVEEVTTVTLAVASALRPVVPVMVMVLPTVSRSSWLATDGFQFTSTSWVVLSEYLATTLSGSMAARSLTVDFAGTDTATGSKPVRVALWFALTVMYR